MPERFKTSAERWTYLILTVDNIQAQLKTVDSRLEKTNKELHGNGGVGICERINEHSKEIETLKQLNARKADKTWQVILLLLAPVVSALIGAIAGIIFTSQNLPM